jgi:hypothetical protein
MTSGADLDIAAFDPPARVRRTGAERTAARCRTRLRRWLDALTEVGRDLVKRMGGLPESRREAPEATKTVDLMLVGGLIGRATRWASALKARLKAEAMAAPAAPRSADVWRERAEPAERPAPLDGGLGWIERRVRRPRRPVPAEKPDPRWIAGKTTAEVMVRICTDLGMVAALLRSASLAGQVAAIAAEAHAMLGGEGEPWTAPPIPPADDPESCEQTATLQAAARQTFFWMRVPEGVPAPDSG